MKYIFHLGWASLFYLSLMFIVPPIAGYFKIGGNSINAQVNGYVTFQSFWVTVIFTIIFFIAFFKFKVKNIYFKSANLRNTNQLILCIFLISFTFKLIKYLMGFSSSYSIFIDNKFYDAFLYIFGVNIFNIVILNLMFANYYTNRMQQRKFCILDFFTWFFFGILLITTILSDGRKFYLIAIFLSAMMMRHFLYKKLSIKIVVSLVIILLFLFPLKNFSRDINSLKYYLGIEFRSSLGHMEKLTLLGYFFPRDDEHIKIFNADSPANEPYVNPIIKLNIEKTYDLYADSFLGRINQSHIFSVIYTKFNGNYYYGKTLLDWIPYSSIIMKKMEFDDIWIASNIIDKTENTSIGTTLYGDMYRNFSFLGASFGIFLLAILYKYFYTIFFNTDSLFRTTIYCSCFPFLIFALEGTIDSLIVVVLKFSFAFSVIYICNQLLIKFSALNRKYI